MSLFVGNIWINIKKSDLHNAFLNYGPCKVDLKKKYAFIEYDSYEDGEQAISHLQGTNLNGLNSHFKLNIEWSKSSEKEAMTTDTAGRRSFARDKERKPRERDRDKDRTDRDRSRSKDKIRKSPPLASGVYNERRNKLDENNLLDLVRDKTTRLVPKNTVILFDQTKESQINIKEDKSSILPKYVEIGCPNEESREIETMCVRELLAFLDSRNCSFYGPKQALIQKAKELIQIKYVNHNNIVD